MREVFMGIPHYPITEYLQLPYSDQVDKKFFFMGSFCGNITVHFPFHSILTPNNALRSHFWVLLNK